MPEAIGLGSITAATTSRSRVPSATVAAAVVDLFRTGTPDDKLHRAEERQISGDRMLNGPENRLDGLIIILYLCVEYVGVHHSISFSLNIRFVYVRCTSGF